MVYIYIYIYIYIEVLYYMYAHTYTDTHTHIRTFIYMDICGLNIYTLYIRGAYDKFPDIFRMGI